MGSQAGRHPLGCVHPVDDAAPGAREVAGSPSPPSREAALAAAEPRDLPLVDGKDPLKVQPEGLTGHAI